MSSVATLRIAFAGFIVAGASLLAPGANAAPGSSATATRIEHARHIDMLVRADSPTDDVTDTTMVWRLENDPSACINSNPRPNCGYKPQDAGERGGALQITLFFVLMTALGVIGTVIGRNVVRRDRAIAEQLRNAASGTDQR